ncbi:hypothetical protein ACUY4R_000070 [Kosakonia sp. BK9b]
MFAKRPAIALAFFIPVLVTITNTLFKPLHTYLRCAFRFS